MRCSSQRGVCLFTMRLWLLFTCALASKNLIGIDSHQWFLPKDDSHLNFSNISMALDTLFHDPPLNPLCNMPHRAVIVTYSNKFHMKLLSLQWKSIKLMRNPNLSCVTRRFMTICLDSDCFAMCKDMNLFNCALVQTTVPLSPSIYLKGAFFYLSFIKYLIIREVFKKATEAFFIDADVLIYCNPWQAGIFSNTAFDFIYSPERVRNRNKINGGQYFLRNTFKVQKWLHLMIQSRDLICNPKQMSSSSSAAIHRKSFTGSALSRSRYTGRYLSSSPAAPLLDQDYARIYADQVGLKATWAPVSALGAHVHHQSNITDFPRSACTNHVCGVTGFLLYHFFLRMYCSVSLLIFAGAEKVSIMQKYLLARQKQESENYRH